MVHRLEFRVERALFARRRPAPGADRSARTAPPVSAPANAEFLGKEQARLPELALLAVALPFLPEQGRFDPSLYYCQLPFSADAVSELGVFFYDQMETHTPPVVEPPAD